MLSDLGLHVTSIYCIGKFCIAVHRILACQVKHSFLKYKRMQIGIKADPLCSKSCDEMVCMSKLEDNFVCYLGLDVVCLIKASRIWCVQFEKA